MIAPGMETDARVVLTAMTLAVGALVNAVAHTTSEGAMPLHRWTMRVAGMALLFGAAYVAVRLWW